MLSSILAIYGAVVSTVLAVFQITKYIRESRFIWIDESYSYTPGESLDHDIWIMNRGVAPISVRELLVGTAVKRKFRQLDMISAVHLLPVDEEERPIPLILGPGEAKYFRYSALALRKDFLSWGKDEGAKETNLVHALEILHSRRVGRQLVPLYLQHHSWQEIDEMIKEDSL